MSDTTYVFKSWLCMGTIVNEKSNEYDGFAYEELSTNRYLKYLFATYVHLPNIKAIVEYIKRDDSSFEMFVPMKSLETLPFSIQNSGFVKEVNSTKTLEKPYWVEKVYLVTSSVSEKYVPSVTFGKGASFENTSKMKLFYNEPSLQHIHTFVYPIR